MTIAQTLFKATEALDKRSDSPRLDAEVLLSFALKRSRAHLMTHPDIPLTASQQRRFFRLVKQRRQRIPIPYLTGRSEFFGLPLRITPAVLVPRPFTELLVKNLVARLTTYHLNPTIADIGTGSGAIALALAWQLPRAKIVGTDVSSAALRIARHNARTLGLAKNTAWRHGSLLKPLRRPLQPQVVIANLPYLTRRQLRAPSIRREPKLALHGGTKGLALIRQLLTQAKALPSLAIIALEFDPPQLPAIRQLLKQWSPKVKIIPISDGSRVRGLIAKT